ncbi:MAG: hypothetical protein GY750_14220 [Lentisphaerae bacterium]|nr:hypothetical protein [Lentisphaerota bacterium]MCP4102556.1 hypothetical protein [Lentisphaerota bacterium]
MNIYTQDNRDLNIEVEGKTGKDTAGSNYVLLTEVLQGSYEAISKPFSMKLQLISPAVNPLLTSEEMLERSTTVKIKTANNIWRLFNGILTDFSFEGYYSYIAKDGTVTKNKDLYSYKATLSPKLLLLKNCLKSRVFHNKSSLDIVKEILQGWQINFEDKLVSSSNYIDKNYVLEQCVQYEESDFDFISRLMETEGIFYNFWHEVGYNNHIIHKMILGNSNPGAELNLAYSESGNSPGVKEFILKEKVIPGSVRFDDYDFRQADKVFYNNDDMSTNQKTALSSAANDMLISKYDAGFVSCSNKADAANYRKKLSSVAVQCLCGIQYEWRGVTDNREIKAGAGFVLTGFPAGRITGLIKRVALRAKTTPFSIFNSKIAIDMEAGFSAVFEAQDITIPFRPCVSASVPKINTTVSAKVITVDNISQAMQDNSSHGFCADIGGNPVSVNPTTYCIKILLNWRNVTSKKTPDLDSMWLNARFGEMWADSCSGKFEVPRKGQEVIVTFLNGNPAQPVVIGSLYNSQISPPVQVNEVENTYSSLIRSSSVANISDGSINSSTNLENTMPFPMAVYDLGSKTKRKGFSQIAVCSMDNGKFSEPKVNEAAFMSDWFFPSCSTSIQKELKIEKNLKKHSSGKGTFFEGINMYSNNDVLSQAAQSQYINAGKNIKISAAGSITLQVGRSKITIKDDGVKMKTSFGAPQMSCGFASKYSGPQNASPEQVNWGLPSFSSYVSIMPGKACMFAPYTYSMGTYEAKIKTWFGTELGGRIGNTSIKGMKTDVAGGFNSDDFIKRSIEVSRDMAKDITAASDLKNDADSQRYQITTTMICKLITLKKYLETIQTSIQTLKSLFTFKSSKISLKFNEMSHSSENITNKAWKNSIEGNYIAPYEGLLSNIPADWVADNISSCASISRSEIDLLEIVEEAPARNEMQAERSSSGLENVNDQVSEESLSAENASVVVSSNEACVSEENMNVVAVEQNVSSSEANLHKEAKAAVSEQIDAILQDMIALVQRNNLMDIEN